MRQITQQGLALIKSFEGFCATSYLCPAGYPTIGYGHVVRAGEDFPTAGITEPMAQALLIKDVALAENAVLRLIDVPLADGQFDALVSFTFNLGAGALQRSTLRRKVNRREYTAATQEFRRWVWAGGKRLPGLVRRREAEIFRFLSS